MIQFFQTRSRTMVDSKDVISVKIEKINDTQIRCTLTSEDLADRQLKLSELAYGSEKAKDLFRDMMLQAQDQFGFEADNVPLMIEAIPITPDSIVLIITKVEDPEELDTRFSKFAAGTDETAPSQTEGPSVTGADDILDLFQKLCEGRLKKPVASSEKNKTEDSSDRKTKIQPDTAETHSDTEAAENSVAGQIECWAEVDSYLYKALGLEYNEEQKAWMWKGKPVYAIWFADTGLTIYGDVKAEGKNCLHITWESSDGTATFKVQEMTKEELKKAYGTSLAE